MEGTRRESAARQKILKTAQRLFYRNGIHATGIDAVIEQADVARMTLYNHFASKEALVEAVLRLTADEMAAAVAPVLTDETLSPREKILAIFDWQAKYLLCDDFRGCPFNNAVVETPDHGSRAFCTAADAKSKRAEALEDCVRDLGVASPEVLAEQLALLMDGALVRAQYGFAEQAVRAARAAAAALIDAARGTGQG